MRRHRHRGPIGDAVRDHADLAGIHAVVVGEQVAGGLGHDHHRTGQAGNILEHLTLMPGRGGQHGVQDDDARRRERGKHGQDLVAIAPAIDAVLVLDDHRIAGAERACRVPAAGGVAVAQLADDRRAAADRSDRRGIVVVDHAHDPGARTVQAGRRGRKGLRERRQSAAGRGVGGEKGETRHGMPHDRPAACAARPRDSRDSRRLPISTPRGTPRHRSDPVRRDPWATDPTRPSAAVDHKGSRPT